MVPEKAAAMRYECGGGGDVVRRWRIMIVTEDIWDNDVGDRHTC